jgi:hypothetical protein
MHVMIGFSIMSEQIGNEMKVRGCNPKLYV